MIHTFERELKIDGLGSTFCLLQQLRYLIHKNYDNVALVTSLLPLIGESPYVLSIHNDTNETQSRKRFDKFIYKNTLRI